MTASNRPSIPSFDATLAVETPEQVMLTYTLAGFGSRALAALIDLLILAVVMIGLGILAAALLFSARAEKFAGDSATGSAWAIAIVVLLEFAIFWGYFVAFEGFNDGQTPGKMVLKLRVVRDGGYSVTLAAAAIRNLVRIIDAQPGFVYAIGAISVFATKSGKRLGDLLAGTFVVHEGKTVYDGGTVRAAPIPHAPITAQLRDEQYELLERFITRRNQLTTERRRVLTAQVAAQLASYIDTKAGTPAAELVALFERERAARATTVATRSDTGAQREQHAIVALGVSRWNEFAVKLAEVRRRGLREMTPSEVFDFVERYRQLTADLARLQTASRSRSIDALFFVSRLVAGGHAVLYRRRVRGMATALHYIAARIPREIRRSWSAIALAALAFFGPAVAVCTAVARNPEGRANVFVAPQMKERADQGHDRIKHGKGYVTMTAPERPIMASVIISNNIQLSYAAFVLGLTAGIGTLWLLILNGVQIGAGMGIFMAKGVAPLLWAFVLPHGVLELSAICIAGGGGLLVGSAIVLPGAMTRREALVVRGRRAITLIAAATLFLAVAGSIEGLISPRVWPLPWKLAVSLTTAVAMCAYVAFGGRGEDCPAELERGALF